MIRKGLASDSVQYRQKYPWTDNTRLHECHVYLSSQKLAGSVWDKRPTDMFAICAAIEERHMLSSTVLSHSFSLVGFEKTIGGAQVYMQSKLHESALERVLDMAVHYSALKKPSLI